MKCTRLAAVLCLAATLATTACAGDSAVDAGRSLDSGSVDAGGVTPDAGPPSSMDAGGPEDAGAVDAGSPPPPPASVEPCEPGRPDACWMALAASSRCGTTTLTENFETGNYNVHTFTVPARAGVELEITLQRTAGAWDPALVLHDAAGATIYDGERGAVGADLSVDSVASGRGADAATVRVSSAIDRDLTGFVTSWAAVDGAFEPRLPRDAVYALRLTHDCPPDEGLLTPPNFDEDDTEGGYFILPESDPSGLYNRKARCSRGNRLLIQVLYTVAVRWAELRPSYAPLTFSDLNECDPRLSGDADHATHDDGTHADLSNGCATQVGCDTAASIDLANLFMDTGEVCGIIFNDGDVQDAVNPRFRAEHEYRTWHGGPERTFMRTVAGHTRHFHVRVKRPDGRCDPLD